MSNSKKMTLEEKLVQHIKNMGLAALIDDEDALTELTRRAVAEALITPRFTGGGYGRSEQEPAPAVAAAKEIAQATTKKLVGSLMADLEKDPEFIKSVKEALITQLPEAIKNYVAGCVSMFAANVSVQAMNEMQQKMRNNMF